jgi:hypothetical protein
MSGSKSDRRKVERTDQSESRPKRSSTKSSSPPKLTHISDSAGPIAQRKIVKKTSTDARENALGARFLRELTESVDALLRELYSQACDRDFIEGLKRFRMSFPDSDDVAWLLRSVQSSNKVVHRNAARSIVRLGSVLLKQSELEEVVTCAVFDALGSDDPEVHRTILPALKWFANSKHSKCAMAFECALCALKDPDERIRLGSLAVLPEFGIDRVLPAFKRIAKALSDKSPPVRQLAAYVLGEWGADAGPAIDDLLVRAAEDEEISVRVAAATAVVKVVEALDRIDPGFEHLDIGPADARLRDGLLAALGEAGRVGQELRQRLQQKWIRAATGGSKHIEEVVPELKDIWFKFTETERRLLCVIWERRRKAGVPSQDVIEAMGWDDAKNPINTLRRHLSAIRKPMRANSIGLELPMKDGRICWR